jgi:hypothetical protein
VSDHTVSRKPHVPAREFLILVGAPSNTFNGYCHWDGAGHKIPNSKPSNTSDAEIRQYTHGDPLHDHATDPRRTYTHDLYWANFLYSAVKLIELGIARPERGDILTIILWLPGYLDRIYVDYQASPYNDHLHQSSVWVAGKKPYDRSVLIGQQGKLAPFFNPEIPNEQPLSTGPAATPEPDLDLEILMRTTNETDPNGGFRKRPTQADDYEQSISNIPRRLVLGSRFGTPLPVSVNVPLMPMVQVKLLLMDRAQQFLDYVKTGAWPNGPKWLNILDAKTDQDMSKVQPMSQCRWTDYFLTKDGKPLQDWMNAPSVDRSRVKIKRFDYFGHSSPRLSPDDDPHPNDDDGFWIQYGQDNNKGSLPSVEQAIWSQDLEPYLSKSLFTNDSYAKLWGCLLGAFMAPMLSKYIDTVIACTGLTSFDHILEASANMPEPADPAKPFVTYHIP